MLIGFNLAPVAASIYWPQDQWVALATMTFVIVASLALRGFIARISILLGLVFGYLLSVLLDVTAGQITSARRHRPRSTDARPDQLRLRRPGRLVRAARTSPPRASR